MENKFVLAPSLLAADFSHLTDEVNMFDRSDADWLHLDVMDGRFVPNITFGMLMVDAVNKLTEKPLDVHLMIVEPEKYVKRFREAGADVISVHAEACAHLHSVLQQIRQSGAKAGVAINPHTPIDVLAHIQHDMDLVCVMSVNPGFGGQKFIEETYRKVSMLAEMRAKAGAQYLIEIDGGVNLHNASKLLSAGADVLVAGSAVFKAENPLETISKFKEVSLSKSIV